MPTDEEKFDIFDEMGNPIGIAPRSKVHREGLWHRAASVFLFRTDGRLLIQRRQSRKQVCPGIWDLSVAEHLLPGESFEEGALRGLREELGVDGIELEPFGDVARSRLELVDPGIRDYEFQQSFRGTFDGRVSPDSSEVMETRLVGLDDLAAELEARPENFTPWFRQRSAELDLFGERKSSAKDSSNRG